MAAAIPADKSLIPVTYANHGAICIKVVLPDIFPVKPVPKTAPLLKNVLTRTHGVAATDIT